jgi:hypothetical protein
MLRPGRLTDFLSVQIPYDYVAYEHIKDSEKFKQLETFLAQVLVNDDMKRYIMESCGLALTGRFREETVTILVGKPASGKTTLQMMIDGTFGGDKKFAFYPGSTALFTKKWDGRSPINALAGCDRARFIRFAEGDPGAVWNSSIFRPFVADSVRARAAYGREDKLFEVMAFTLITLNEKELPTFQASDEADWRRVNYMKCQEDGFVKNTDFKNHLDEYRQSMMAMILNYHTSHRKSGHYPKIDVPQEMIDYKAEIMSKSPGEDLLNESEGISRCCETCFVKGDGHRLRIMDLKTIVEKYAAEHGYMEEFEDVKKDIVGIIKRKYGVEMKYDRIGTSRLTSSNQNNTKVRFLEGIGTTLQGVHYLGRK